MPCSIKCTDAPVSLHLIPPVKPAAPSWNASRPGQVIEPVAHSETPQLRSYGASLPRKQALPHSLVTDLYQAQLLQAPVPRSDFAAGRFPVAGGALNVGSRMTAASFNSRLLGALGAAAGARALAGTAAASGNQNLPQESSAARPGVRPRPPRPHPCVFAAGSICLSRQNVSTRYSIPYPRTTQGDRRIQAQETERRVHGKHVTFHSMRGTPLRSGVFTQAFGPLSSR